MTLFTPDVDFSEALIPGPWEHRYVSAGGARFHLAQTGPHALEAPLVVLVHGFPQFWWAWRHQLTSLGEAGYRTVALDLRGYAASDKPPQGHTLPQMAADVAAVIGSLGAPRAVVVGQDLGGLVAWTLAAFYPSVCRGVAVFDAPHPAAMPFRVRNFTSPRAFYQTTGLRVPGLAERGLVRGETVNRCLATWSAAGWDDEEAAHRYRRIIRVPFAASKAVEQLRWALRSPVHSEQRRYLAGMADPVHVPVLHAQGDRDRLLRAQVMAAPAHGGARYRFEYIKGAGHFAPEEAPDAATGLLLTWLDSLGSPA
jgi:pimeloyl-ACP methyl ester carboxylesterase